MNGITKDQFELQRIKVLKGGSGIEVDFNVSRDDSGNTVTDRYSKETTTYPHPDLLKAIDSLKDLLIEATGKETLCTEGVLEEFESKFKKATDYEAFLYAIQRHIHSEKSKITVTGISVSGTESNEGVIITGTYLCKNGSKIAINSPRIRYSSETMGFESELRDLCDKIEEEAYLYTFEGEEAQQEIVFGNDGKN